jgi:iodotyrosine deiodinase
MQPSTIPYRPPRLPPDEGQRRADALFETLSQRRSVRHFSPDPVPLALIERLVATAATAPSGAHKQPWTFVAVGDPSVKERIREAAEAEERENYASRMSEEWLRDLAPLGTDAVKAHLTEAPWLVVVFAQRWGRAEDGTKRRHYYVDESVGIAVGMFLAAATVAGLATLTHTPSPMHFLDACLGRPANERAYVVIPVGYPAPDCEVPDLARKPLSDVLVTVP